MRVGGIALLALGSLLLASCSSVAPVESRRKGLFDDLARRGGKGGASERGTSSLGGSARGDVTRDDGRRAAEATEESEGALAELARSVKLRWPLQAVQVTSPFGRRNRDFHEGIDLRAPIGTPVHAAQGGTVIFAGTRIRGYGKLVVLRHAGGVATVYAHNSKLLVRRGQKVRLGQKIALSGNTGRSSGPHLHFEVRKGVSAVNPVAFLPGHGIARIERPRKARAYAVLERQGRAGRSEFR